MEHLDSQVALRLSRFGHERLGQPLFLGIIFLFLLSQRHNERENLIKLLSDQVYKTES